MIHKHNLFVEEQSIVHMELEKIKNQGRNVKTI